MLFLAPVTIAATSLSFRRALGLLGPGARLRDRACRAWSLPLPWLEGESLALPPIYVLGSGVALVVSAAFVALYAYRVAAGGAPDARAL